MIPGSVVEHLASYLPQDRARAVLGGASLPESANGTVLYADISGFTPLTEAVAALYGPRRGGEELTDRLNQVYDALIGEVDLLGGSVVGFAGDAMTTWFPGEDPAPAMACALAMQAAIGRLARIELPGGQAFTLGMKVAVATGTVRRACVGDPEVQFLDVLGGRVIERLVACESVARRGEVIADARTCAALGERVAIREWRPAPGIEDPGNVALIEALRGEAPARPLPELAPPEDAAERLRPWIIPEVYRRVSSGQFVFLTELRPTAALFAQFGGMDFDNDAEAAAKLDTYVRWVQRIIAPLEGVLIQLTIGEKGSFFYAAFGAPLAHDNDTARSLTVALELANPPEDIRALVPAVQIGVTRGTMRTGAYGGRNRRTYGILGDDTNLAARFMQKAGRNQVLVSERAARRQRAAFEFASLPLVTVKGKQHPIPVFALLGRRRAESVVLQEDRYKTPMIGRATERAFAIGCLQRAGQGEGQLLAISGEAGMGKSRLVAEIAREAMARGFAAFAGDCPVQSREASYAVWLPIWRRFFDAVGMNDPGDLLAHLRARLAAINADLEERAPLLGTVLGLRLPENDLTKSLEGRVRQSSLIGLLVECVRHRARQESLVLVLEECHWIDGASRNLLAALTQAIARMRVMIILCHRPLDGGAILGAEEGSAEYVHTLELGDLPLKDARELVRLRLGGLFAAPAEPPAQLVDLISGKAGGNPFFAEELVTLLETRKLDFARPLDLGQLELPASLHSLILGRIDQLAHDARTTLKVASVIGREFRSVMLWGIHPLERSSERISLHLGEACKRDLAVPEPAGAEEAYLFKHIAIQEVAYETLPYSLRSTIHEAIGDYIEKLPGHDAPPLLDLLAFHFDRSDRLEKRRHYLVAAGDAAAAAYSNQSAISYYERALPLLGEAGRIEVLQKVGAVLEVTGQWDAAADRFKEALGLAERAARTRQQAACVASIGDLLRKRGQFVEANSCLERAKDLYATCDDRAGVGNVLHFQGILRAQSGDFEAATRLFSEALEIRLGLGDEAAAAKSLNNLAIVSRFQGKLEATVNYHERSLEIRRRLNDKREIANSLNNLAIVHQHNRDFERARSTLEESLRLNRAVGDRWATANALTSLAEIALDMGDVATAAASLTESITTNRELGDRRALAFLLEACGHLGRMKGAAETALAFYAAAQKLRSDIGAPNARAEAKKVDSDLEALRESLGPDGARRAEEMGRTTALEVILDRAQAAYGRGEESNGSDTAAP